MQGKIDAKDSVGKEANLSNEEHDGLLETLDILSCKEERAAIARAKAQVKKGKTVSVDSIKKKYDFS